MNELEKQEVIDVLNGQAATWLSRRDNAEAGDEVEASTMYQLLADMALQHADLVERIK